MMGGMTYDDLCNKYTIIGRNKRLDSKMQVKVTASEIRVYYEEALTKEPQMLINFLIREIIVFDDKYTSTSIVPYRRVLTQVRAFLFVTGKRPYRRISRTRMS